ncbi:MAG: glycosyltransferase family 2 protein [Candidatus Kerfeldbacteria bacterium]|nr:glycosyltransferase family 2 protein [Candidatus Kerfeldbacteria bacterium]
MGFLARPSFKAFRLSEHTQYRILEIIPGFLVWGAFGVAVIMSLLRPLWVIGFIILFDLYWFVRAIYTLVYLLVAYQRYRQAAVINWRQRLAARPGWQSIYHVVVLPTYREPVAVVEQAFAGLACSDYPLERLLVILALEERDGQVAQAVATRIQQRYGQTFGELLVTFHPANRPGEVAGKGANITWAGRAAKERIDARGIPEEQVLVTTLDVDSVVHPQYFAYLTDVFLAHPHRLRTSYQPLPFYHNNIWQSPALTRIVATSTTFWLMTETIRPDRLFTFSSHSMPLRALVDVGFWQTDIVTEDSRIFLQCFVQYDGDYTVTPLYLPISMDTVAVPSLWRTVLNQYQQQRRWAYGVENFPYMVWNFSVNRHIPGAKKIKYIWNQLEGVFSWATAPILIFVLGWLPIKVAEAQQRTELIVQSAPDLLQTLMVLAMIGLVTAAVMSVLMLPPPPPGKSKWQLVPMVLQWLLLPVTMIIFGSIPATDAQTRLMLGKYLGFWVTEKSRTYEPRMAPTKSR